MLLQELGIILIVDGLSLVTYANCHFFLNHFYAGNTVKKYLTDNHYKFTDSSDDKRGGMLMVRVPNK